MPVTAQQPRVCVFPRFLSRSRCCCCRCFCCRCCGYNGFLVHECDIVATEGAAGRDGHAAVDVGGMVMLVVLLVLLELVVVREGGGREGEEGLLIFTCLRVVVPCGGPLAAAAARAVVVAAVGAVGILRRSGAFFDSVRRKARKAYYPIRFAAGAAVTLSAVRMVVVRDLAAIIASTPTPLAARAPSVTAAVAAHAAAPATVAAAPDPQPPQRRRGRGKDVAVADRRPNAVGRKGRRRNGGRRRRGRERRGGGGALANAITDGPRGGPPIMSCGPGGCE